MGGVAGSFVTDQRHTLSHLAHYLEEFERNATANGIVVHWAADATK